MFRAISEQESEDRAEGGTRHLFALGHFQFRDSLNADGELHHFVSDSGDTEEGLVTFEVDQFTMYEFMARYLAGEYEKREYDLERSPAQDALLDTLEIAAARARSGDTEFEFEDLDVSQDWEEIEGELEDERS